MLLEVRRRAQDRRLLRMSLTPDRKAVVEIFAIFQQLEEQSSRLLASSAGCERVHVTDHDYAASGAR